ncbi:hypothetical protein BV22DRAFT_622922 [Leucogyrophana mollusca]|uniref:Uncharacterized protein n=1 Tax=Leucogyrophana mollusca TaxID=85980 RepID=A0ACB8BDM5_9AGAM|nr:hypothetical protein BV22DRAFT_622922 [Leucogyrophana mollusca]
MSSLRRKSMARDALWASFQASVVAPPPKAQEHPPKKMVKIEKRYLFAGKNIVEVVDVEEGSEDAKKWPIWVPKEQIDVAEPIAGPSSTVESRSNPTDTPSADAQPDPSKATQPGKRPGPRRPRTSLPAIPTPASQKAKKLTTLDKSAMDWRSHVTSQPADIKDELDANRRGGGYLEKVEFLKRVEDRKEDALDASKSSKRRRTQL